MNRIIFNLKKKWYDKIASGEKKVEYRRICEHWARKLFAKWPIGPYEEFVLHGGMTYDEPMLAVFRRGYSKIYRDIVRRIVKIDIGPCPYEGWDGEYFRIHFEKVVGDS